MNREPTEMELRVAKSICYERGIDPDQSYTLAGEEARPQYLEWLDEARAAIRAMREPTEKMACAAQWSQFETANPPVQACVDAKLKAISIWGAMINAASPPEET